MRAAKFFQLTPPGPGPIMPAMTDGYEFFEHTADIGVRVFGRSLPDLFANATKAMYAALGEWTTGERVTRQISLPAGTHEDLLHDWLSELLFEFETRRLVFDHFEFTQLDDAGLKATVTGGIVELARSRPHEEIKAVTYHQLRVERGPGGQWRANVIFDV